MKKLNLLFLVAMLFGALFTSCSSDEDEIIPEEDKPVITVYDEANNVITNVNDLNAGETKPVTVKFAWGAQESKLVNIKITTELQGQSFVVLDSALNEGLFNGADKQLIRKYNIAVGQTTSTITFKATDKKGREGSTKIIVAPKGTKIPETRRVVLWPVNLT